MWSLKFNEQAYENDLFDLKEGVMSAAISTYTIIQDLGDHFKNVSGHLNSHICKCYLNYVPNLHSNNSSLEEQSLLRKYLPSFTYLRT